MDNSGRKCNFCSEEAEAIDGMRVCSKCQVKFGTHIGVICAGCFTCYWLPKSPQNVAELCEAHGYAPEFVMSNALMLGVPYCRACEVGNPHTLH
jgi:hypothetical protein